MSNRPTKLLLILLSAYLCPVRQIDAQVVDPARQLSEQGNYWRTHQRSDLAVGAWKKLLALKPDNPEAIWGLGMAEADLQHGDAARGYLATLERVAPNYAGLASLAERLGVQTPGATAIQDARKLARDGRFDDAVAQYRQAFGGSATPPADIAIEYYETLAGSKSGWSTARSGIEQLARANPGDARIRLSAAKILTYNTASRREGIAKLEALFDDKDVGNAAKQSCHQALLWLDGKPSDAPQFDAYLRAVPDDKTVRDAMQTGLARAARDEQGQATAKAQKAAFDAINLGDLDVAEKHFAGVLAGHPNDRDALGGMGLVRLRQQRFEEAQDLLTRASQGSNDPRWRQALASATYWSLIRQATTQRDIGDAGHLASARALAERAVRLNPDEVTGRLLLADLADRAGDAAGAERAYRAVLGDHPDNANALRGLVRVLIAAHRDTDAIALLNSIPADHLQTIGGLDTVRADLAKLQASAALQRDDRVNARAWLAQSIALNPDDPWARFDLGRLDLQEGMPDAARSVVGDLDARAQASAKTAPDALYAAALLCAELGDSSRGLQLLGRIPGTARTNEMALLERRLRVRQTAQQAVSLAAVDRRSAIASLDAVVIDARGDIGSTSALASAYADLGDDARAVALMRSSLESGPGGLGNTSADGARSDDAKLAYAALLLKIGRTADAGAMLARVGPALTRAQRSTFDGLVVACVVRRADALRGQGELAAAYDAIAPGLRAYPDNADLQAALARLYVAADNYDAALAHYEAAQQARPDDTGLILEAAAAAASGGRNADAKQAIQRAVSLAPSDAQVLAEAGRISRTLGESRLASAYLNRSLEIDRDAASAPYQQSQQSGLFGALRDGSSSGNAQSNGQSPANPFSGTAFAAKGVSGAIVALAMLGGLLGTMPSTSRADTSNASATYSQQGNPADFAAYGTTYGTTQDLEDTGMQRRLTRNTSFAGNDDSDASGSAANGGSDSARRARVATVERELATIHAEQASTVSAGVEVRTRQGENGLSSLTDIESPIEGRVGFGQGHLIVRATPVTLDAGTADTSTTAPQRFGNGGVSSATASATPGSQHASGVGLGIGYETSNVAADVGTTPLAFRESNIVGGLRVQIPLTQQTHLTVDASRRAVTDSLLSYAGATDARTGKTWGGVTAAGGRGEFGWDDGTNGAYVYGSYHVLRGHEVESNTRTEGGGGAYTRVLKDDNQELSVGVNLTYLHYDKNLSYYTLGQGGYFSPQQFIQASVPVRWNLHSGRYAYEVRASLGVQHFREDDSPFYPTDSALESAATSSTSTNGLNGVYKGQSKTGLGYSLSAGAEYQATPQVFLGAYMGVDNARDYTQYAGGVYIRYSWQKLLAGLSAVPQALQSPYLKN